MITIEIDGNDVTSLIQMGSLRKEDILNSKIDTLRFSVAAYAVDHAFVPDLDAEVIMMVDSVKQYGGRIISYDERVTDNKIVSYDILCRDYSIDANRMLIQERYQNMTVTDIITDIVANYAPDFTVVNVNCSVMVTTITFDRVTLIDALDKLSKMTNFSYYIDYDKDIHFFQKNAEPAPFNLDDTSGNYEADSIEINRDISQIRNRVYIRGGEIEGLPRTEKFNGDGVKLTFPHGNKFASKPTVIVGGVSKTVGIDFVDLEADYECFWNKNEKYIRFKTSTVPPSGTNNIEITGIPLFILVMRIEDSASITQFGLAEFSAEDKTIRSREEAKTFGIAQLEAYASSVVEGSFKTYTPGLRSGQLIEISSAVRGWTEQFLIQKVTFVMISQDVYTYNVTLATLRTMGIIEFLVGLMLSGREVVGDDNTDLLEKVYFEVEQVEFTEEVITSKVHNPQVEDVEIDEDTPVVNIDFGTEFVLGPYVPSGPADVKRQFILDGSPLA